MSFYNTTDASASAFTGPDCGTVTRLPSFGFDIAVHVLPPVVSREQAYYWSRAWQADEHESHVDIANGSTMSFSDPSDAIRWLLSEDD